MWRRHVGTLYGASEYPKRIPPLVFVFRTGGGWRGAAAPSEGGNESLSDVNNVGSTQWCSGGEEGVSSLA